MAPKKKKKKEKKKTKVKAEAKEKGKRKARAEAKDKGKPKIKGKGKGKGRGKKKAKAKTEAKGKAKSKGKDKGKLKGKGKGKGKGKKKADSQVKAKGKGKAQRGKTDQIAIQMVTPEELATADVPNDEPTETPDDADKARAERAPPVGARPEQRRWERVAARLGLEPHARAVAGWDGQGDPPTLSGFSFVRHVESDARDLRCAGTARTMTQGVVVQRDDGKLFLVGLGVAKKYLGVQVPHKDRANAGQRFLTPLERDALGQPTG